ncbi:MAG: B12-binding domain-containing radical SAM protein [Candidatus Heimdallarchaeota archaeon]|nr:MAG: B12-binding domain-containing radical SAM protein [Candidatus Heimdallarchaeota archaeon]
MPNSIWAWHLYQVLPNIGIASIAGNIDEDFEVDVADLVLVRANFRSFLENRITKHAPDIIGLSAMSFSAKTALYIAKFIKHLDPKIQIVIGGYHATTMGEEITQSESLNLDFIIRGEGESTFNELLAAIEYNKDLNEIKGLSFKKKEKFVHNPRRKLEDLTTLKLPRRSARILTKGFHSMGLKADVVESSRGCVNNCDFCSMTYMYGRNFRKYTIERVLDDIEECKKGGVKAIMFADDNITLDSKHLALLCEGIIERNLNKIHYIVQASVKGLYDKPELLKKIVEANFKLIFLGIENPNPKILRSIGKNVRNQAEKSKSIISYLRSQKVLAAGGFILGSPDDTKEDFLNVVKFVKKIKIDMPIFQFLTPFPKTTIRERLLETNLVFNTDDYSNYDTLTPNVKTHHLTREEIIILRERMWDEFLTPDWFVTNGINIARLYPWHSLKTVLRSGPRLLKKTLNRMTRAKSEYEIADEILQEEKDFRDLKRFTW